MGPKMFLYLAVNMFTSALKLNILTWKSHFLGPLKWPLEELEIYGVFRGFGGGLFFFSSLSTKPLIAAVVCRLWHFICGILIPQLKLYSLPGALCFQVKVGASFLKVLCVCTQSFQFQKVQLRWNDTESVSRWSSWAESHYLSECFQSPICCTSKKHFALLRMLQYAKYRFTYYMLHIVLDHHFIPFLWILLICIRI